MFPVDPRIPFPVADQFKGGVLSGYEIIRIRNATEKARQEGKETPVPSILLEPFNEKFAGPNSYDIHLSHELRVYKIASAARMHRAEFEKVGIGILSGEQLPEGVDSHEDTPTVELTIPPEGRWLMPGVLYLGATVEKTLCCGLVPWLDGRSSVGRLGLSVHVTAGRGDDGWPGRWTMEMQAETHPVKVYPNMRIGQVTYFTLVGERKPYNGRYRDQDGPTASRLHVDAKEDELYKRHAGNDWTNGEE